jgi:hypothetical protein
MPALYLFGSHCPVRSSCLPTKQFVQEKCPDITLLF